MIIYFYVINLIFYFIFLTKCYKSYLYTHNAISEHALKFKVNDQVPSPKLNIYNEWISSS